MDENTNVQTEAMDTAFLDGLNEEDGFAPPAEDAQEGGQISEDGQDELREEPQEQEQPQKQQEQEPAKEQLYELKHLGQPKQVSLGGMKELAQKGMDYDRIRQRSDQLTEENRALSEFRQQNEGLVAHLSAMAKDMGMDVPAMLEALEVNMLVASGMERQAATGMVQRRSEGRKQQYQEAQRAAQAKADTEKRIAADIKQFQAAYPDADLREVVGLPEVQTALNNGSTLVEAYGRYELSKLQAENQRMKQELQAAKQNADNKQRSVGSMVTSGAAPATDPFMDGFNQEW